MATKKKLVTETAAPTSAVKAASPKRHSKAIPTTEASVAAAPVQAAERSFDSREIAELAYSYFVARGYQHGSQAEDWFRAERELRQRRVR